MRALRWTARQTRRLVAAVGLLGLLAGIPVGLWRFVGWPLPRTVPTSWAGWQHLLAGEFPDTGVVNLLAVAAWIVWAAFAYSVATEWRAARQHRPARRLPALSLVQAVAALLVAALLATPVAVAAATPPAPRPAVVQLHPGTSAAAPLVITTTAPAAADRSSITVPADADRLPRFAVARADGPLLVQVGNQRYTVTVHKGDTLWDISAVWLGDPHRWPEIYQLNKDRYDQQGRMRGGDHIEPTWVLVLPVDARPPAGTPPTQPPAQPDRPKPPSAGPSTPASPAPSPSTATSPPATTTPPAATPGAGDDGVAPPPAATPPAATAPAGTPSGTGSAAASPTPSAYAPPSSRAPQTASPPGISLPGGSWVDLGLAAALAATAALVWKLRRRRATVRPPSPDLRLDDPDLAPMPPVVAKVRRGLRRAALQTAYDTDGPLDNDEPSDAPEPVPGPAPDPAPQGRPVAPALEHPLIAVWPPAGLGLTGPGAEAAARGFLTAALAAGADHEPLFRGQVVVPAATLATLLGTQAVTVTDTPRLTVTTGLPEALDLLDAATLHRTRLVFEAEVDTVTELRDADPIAEPLPPVLLLADATSAHERTRIAALLTQGQRLDIHGVLVGAWGDGDTVHVAADGTTQPAGPAVARHGGHPADIGRLAVLDPAETADALRTLAEAHTGMPQPAPPVEHTPTGPPASHPRTAGHAEDEAEPAEPPRLAAAPPATDTSDNAEPADDPADGGGAQAPAPAATGRARVQVLGAPDIVDLPPPTQREQPLRSKAREILVYLAANGGQAPQHRILADVLASERQSKAHHRLNTFISNLRTCLARAGGKARYIGPPDEHYALNRDTVDVDLWRMQDAIATASTAGDPATRIAALRQAVAGYTGPLAAGRDYEWVEPYREAVRQQAIDAHVALAAALADTDPTAAAQVLRAAISHDPYHEALYQQAMHLHARLGDVDAIRDLRRQLTTRLDEIDTEPGEDTHALADRLVADLQRRPRRPSPLHGDAA